MTWRHRLRPRGRLTVERQTRPKPGKAAARAASQPLAARPVLFVREPWVLGAGAWGGTDTRRRGSAAGAAPPPKEGLGSDGGRCMQPDHPRGRTGERTGPSEAIVRLAY
jgi:hypothetical protein